MLNLCWVVGSDQFVWNLGDVAADAEKSKAVVATMLNRTKKRTMRMTKPNSKPAWGKLLSQCSQVEFYS